MNWLDVLMIVFSATAANHLGLVAAVEQVLHRPLPVINCPKCLTFWATLTYGCSVCCDSIAALLSALPHLFALSLLCAWLAVWLDLAMGIIDHLYIKVYDTFYPTANPTDPDAPSPSDSLPVVSE
jgi:hypothetical protein